MTRHLIATRDEWTAARRRLLIQEKELTRRRDELARQRRDLPWVKVEKHYRFEGPDGPKTLADLFAGRSQLIVQHFMFGPGWSEGCVGCSLLADHHDAALQHVEQRDVTLVAVSRAPWPEIDAFRRRMGWRFPWVSSFGSDFNFDYQVSFTEEEKAKGRVTYNFETQDFLSEELSGISVFFRDAAGDVFHTYSTYGRGGEELLGVYRYLDLVPKGRDENGPGGDLTDWVRHHDRYDEGGHVDRTGRYVAPDASAPCCEAAKHGA